MKRIMCLVLLSLAASGFFLPCRAGPLVDMRTGLWEIAVEVEMAEGSVRVPAITTRQCITPENILPEIDFFNANNQNCKITNFVILKNNAAYDLACALENGEMKGHGSVSYRGERLQGSLTTVMLPGNIPMSYVYTGWYIGPCK